jgi:hypothetical protein
MLKFKHPSITLILGAPGSGKSTFLKSFIYDHAKTFNYGWLISPNIFDPEAYNYIPKDYQLPSLDKETLRKILSIQAQRFENDRKCEAFLLIDDFNNQFVKANNYAFQLLIQNHRHFHISIFLATQYLKFFPTYARENVNYSVICGRIGNLTNYKSVFEHIPIGNLFDNHKKFKDEIEKSCVDHKSLIIVNLPGQELKKMLIRPKIAPGFKLKY